jgi:hypothetical protein
VKGNVIMFIKREGAILKLQRTSLSAIVVAAMLLGTFFCFGWDSPQAAYADDGPPAELGGFDITRDDGSPVVVGDTEDSENADVYYDGTGETLYILGSNALTVSGNTNGRIAAASGGTVSLTLNGVSIDRDGAEGAPISVEDSTHLDLLT